MRWPVALQVFQLMRQQTAELTVSPAISWAMLSLPSERLLTENHEFCWVFLSFPCIKRSNEKKKKHVGSYSEGVAHPMTVGQSTNYVQIVLSIFCGRSWISIP